MIYLKSESEIDKMRESAQIVSRTLGKVAAYIEPGVTTAKLNQVAEEYIESQDDVRLLRAMALRIIHFQLHSVSR